MRQAKVKFCNYQSLDKQICTHKSWFHRSSCYVVINAYCVYFCATDFVFQKYEFQTLTDFRNKPGRPRKRKTASPQIESVCSMTNTFIHSGWRKYFFIRYGTKILYKERENVFSDFVQCW